MKILSTECEIREPPSTAAAAFAIQMMKATRTPFSQTNLTLIGLRSTTFHLCGDLEMLLTPLAAQK